MIILLDHPNQPQHSQHQHTSTPTPTSFSTSQAQGNITQSNPLQTKAKYVTLNLVTFPLTKSNQQPYKAFSQHALQIVVSKVCWLPLQQNQTTTLVQGPTSRPPSQKQAETRVHCVSQPTHFQYPWSHCPSYRQSHEQTALNCNSRLNYFYTQASTTSALMTP
jgi:hypothetical protein